MYRAPGVRRVPTLADGAELRSCFATHAAPMHRVRSFSIGRPHLSTSIPTRLAEQPRESPSRLFPPQPPPSSSPLVSRRVVRRGSNVGILPALQVQRSCIHASNSCAWAFSKRGLTRRRQSTDRQNREPILDLAHCRLSSKHAACIAQPHPAQANDGKAARTSPAAHVNRLPAVTAVKGRTTDVASATSGGWLSQSRLDVARCGRGLKIQGAVAAETSTQAGFGSRCRRHPALPKSSE